MPVLNRFTPYCFALLRIVGGALFALHGAQKLFGVLGGTQQPLASMMGLAGIIEFFGGVLVAIGLFSPYAAFIASGQMASAYFMAHAPQSFWPILNGGELAALYCFLFLFIAANGSGPLRIDAMRAKR